MDSQADKQVSASEAEERLKQLKRQSAEILKNFIDPEPVLFVKYLCEAILGVGDAENNPFSIMFDTKNEFESNIFASTRRFNGGFAKLMLDKVNEEEGEGQDRSCEYFPFVDMIRANFHVTFKWLRADDLGEVSDLFSLIHAFMERYSGDLGSAVDSAAYMVYEGVPVYKKNASGAIERISFYDPLYIYVFKKGELWETGKITHIPEWVDGLYFKRSDIEVHDTYFSGCGELTEESRNLRRQAVWRTLGIDRDDQAGSVKSPERVHKTRMLDAVQAVIERYYGPQFNEADRSTYTTQDVVIEWLKSNLGLSQRQAEAIDIVTRPR